MNIENIIKIVVEKTAGKLDENEIVALVSDISKIAKDNNILDTVNYAVKTMKNDFGIGRPEMALTKNDLSGPGYRRYKDHMSTSQKYYDLAKTIDDKKLKDLAKKLSKHYTDFHTPKGNRLFFNSLRSEGYTQEDFDALHKLFQEMFPSESENI